jgi:predicted alpha/beta-hydrolase family hydrolase
MHELPGESRSRGSLISVETPVGGAEVILDRGSPRPIGLLALGHGAGGSIDAPDLTAVTAAALDAGFAVARVRQPYSVAGRRAPAPASQLDAAWIAVVGVLVELFHRAQPGLRFIVGGRSSGARVACRTADASGACGVVALAFPLHPPGHPERSRATELEVAVPLLVVQGARDAFGTAAQFPPHVMIREVPHADHRLIGPDVDAAIDGIVEWLVATITAPNAAPGIGPPQSAL